MPELAIDLPISNNTVGGLDADVFTRFDAEEENLYLLMFRVFAGCLPPFASIFLRQPGGIGLFPARVERRGLAVFIPKSGSGFMDAWAAWRFSVVAEEPAIFP